MVRKRQRYSKSKARPEASSSSGGSKGRFISRPKGDVAEFSIPLVPTETDPKFAKILTKKNLEPTIANPSTAEHHRYIPPRRPASAVSATRELPSRSSPVQKEGSPASSKTAAKRRRRRFTQKEPPGAGEVVVTKSRRGRKITSPQRSVDVDEVVKNIRRKPSPTRQTPAQKPEVKSRGRKLERTPRKRTAADEPKRKIADMHPTSPSSGTQSRKGRSSVFPFRDLSLETRAVKFTRKSAMRTSPDTRHSPPRSSMVPTVSSLRRRSIGATRSPAGGDTSIPTAEHNGGNVGGVSSRGSKKSQRSEATKSRKRGGGAAKTQKAAIPNDRAEQNVKTLSVSLERAEDIPALKKYMKKDTSKSQSAAKTANLKKRVSKSTGGRGKKKTVLHKVLID